MRRAKLCAPRSSTATRSSFRPELCMRGTRGAILLVDDDPDNRLSLSWILQSEGYNVVQAGTGTEGLRLVAQGVELVLLDVGLPDMSGHDVCRAIKTSPNLSAIPVIQLSGHFISSDDRVRGLEGGADLYLTKPVQPRELLAHIKALLRLRGAEQSLRESEQRFRSVLESSRDMIYRLNLGTQTYDYVSPACRDVLGYEPEDLVAGGLSFLVSLLHPGDVLALQEHLEHLQAGHLEKRFSPVVEYRARHRDGEYRWLSDSRVQIAGLDGAAGAIVGSVRDITDRKRADEVLRERERQLSALFEGARDAMLIADDAARICEANPAACVLFDMPHEQIVGRALASSIENGDDVEKTWGLFLGQERVSGEWRLVRPNQTTREVEFVASANFLPGQHLLILRDATERRQLEDQLRQSQKMEAIGRLAGGIAHDFNNLLTVIGGYGEMLLRQIPPQEYAYEMVREMNKASERAAALTRQLLAFSRKQILAPQPVNLNQMIRDSEELLRRLIGEDIELAINLAEDLGTVRADPPLFSQVLLNLAVNARDAMPTGGQLRLETKNTSIDEEFARTHAEVVPGEYVLLSVSDTGSGMDESAKSHVFEPFFTTKEQGKGTGLGLAMVYGSVRQSGGHIAVESSVGRGTTFRILLPRVDDKAMVKSATVDLPPTRTGTETILLAEDEDGVRGMAAQALRACGYTVLEARDGADAIGVSQQYHGRIDLLVTDVVMPRVSGRQLADWLRPHRPEMKILFMSGYTDDAVFRHGVQRAETNFLQKPFSAAKLSSFVREVLDGVVSRAV
jgi:two-component system cell cycle sensor histidine kinase/response regulator CckA